MKSSGQFLHPTPQAEQRIKFELGRIKCALDIITDPGTGMTRKKFHLRITVDKNFANNLPKVHNDRNL